jgi:chemotaxis protein methyltransferase CheR
MNAPWPASSLEQIGQLVAARTGLLIARSPDDLASATKRTLAKLNDCDLAELTAELHAGRHWDELIDELTIGETYFFRNPEHFALVRERILPNLRAERTPGHIFKLWSAGCASGEEAYSLAIMLAELGLLERSRVLGTDISPAALAKARRARYREWSFRGFDDALAERYFRQDQRDRTPCEEIRRAVKFAQLNLASDEYPSPTKGTSEVDLIFCRNVLIYFDAETIAHVERRIDAALAPNGWLVTGPSDPLLGQASRLEVVVTSRMVCYRKTSTTAGRAAITGAPVVPLMAARVVARSAPSASARDEETGSLPPWEVAVPPSPTPMPTPSENDHAQPLAAFARAAYGDGLALANGELDAARQAILGVRATFNQTGSEAAERACIEALARHGLSAELHYLHGMALFELRKLTEAAAALRRVIYLDRGLCIAHFTLGAILVEAHDLAGARRAYEVAKKLAGARAADEVLPFGDGIVAAGLVAAASHALDALARRRPGC